MSSHATDLAVDAKSSSSSMTIRWSPVRKATSYSSEIVLLGSIVSHVHGSAGCTAVCSRPVSCRSEGSGELRMRHEGLRSSAVQAGGGA